MVKLFYLANIIQLENVRKFRQCGFRLAQK